MIEIDWSRMSVPQGDGYDTQRLFELANEKFPCDPLHVDLGNQIFAMPVKEGVPQAGLVPVDINDPHVQLLREQLSNFPVGTQHLDIVDELNIYRTEGFPEGTQGCTSGHTHPRDNRGYIQIMVTVDDPIGAADGILHEIAHQRLHLMGMDLEDHDRSLILNPNVREYFSPIRRDVLRPMSALIHGIYAWTFMLENELVAPGGAQYLRINVPKVRLGLKTISEFVTPTENGKKFIDSFLAWGYDLVSRSEQKLKTERVAEIPVPPFGG